MQFSEIINYILYALSGFCFGIFASRYSVLSILKIKTAVQSQGLSGVFTTLPQLGFIIISFFVFPVFFISKTPVGGFFYYTVLLYFFNKGYRQYIKR